MQFSQLLRIITMNQNKHLSEVKLQFAFKRYAILIGMVCALLTLLNSALAADNSIQPAKTFSS